jgi:hypothetical protein
MSKICQITGRKAAVGNNVSHSKRRTKRKFEENSSGLNSKFGFVLLFQQQDFVQSTRLVLMQH